MTMESGLHISSKVKRPHVLSLTKDVYEDIVNNQQCW